MGRRKKFTVKQLESTWEEYKDWCDNQMSIDTCFGNKSEAFVTGVRKSYVTYTVEGFCVYLKLSRSNFYATYCNDEKYQDIVTRIKEECEVDARMKFEKREIPEKLAGMWMSKYEGYSQKQEIELPGSRNVEVTIKNSSGIEDDSLAQ